VLGHRRYIRHHQYKGVSDCYASPTKTIRQDPWRWDAPSKVRFAMDSPLEGSGFEPSVPRQEKWPSSSDQTRVGRTLTWGGGAESTLDFGLGFTVAERLETRWGKSVRGGNKTAWRHTTTTAHRSVPVHRSAHSTEQERHNTEQPAHRLWPHRRSLVPTTHRLPNHLHDDPAPALHWRSKSRQPRIFR
jgi:hypothetical protein